MQISSFSVNLIRSTVVLGILFWQLSQGFFFSVVRMTLKKRAYKAGDGEQRGARARRYTRKRDKRARLTPLKLTPYNGFLREWWIWKICIWKMRMKEISSLLQSLLYRLRWCTVDSFQCLTSYKFIPSALRKSCLLHCGVGISCSFCFFQKRETPLHWCSRSGNHEIVEEIFTNENVPAHVKLSIINKTTEVTYQHLLLWFTTWDF